MVALSWGYRSIAGRTAGEACSVLLLLLACATPGVSFIQGRGIARQRTFSYGAGRIGRLQASSKGAYPPPSRRLRGRGLYMDARSSAPEITDDSFEAEVLDEDRPVLVFFRAPWCGPCRMVGPIVDEVIADHGGKLKVLELCTDENPKTVAEFKIRNIPTLMLFSHRKSVMTVVGAVPKSALVSSIKKHMDL
ncbi:unnamed protein product [Ectocarpus sp. 12 AP-2014]